MPKLPKTLTGFLILFALYHLAEYFVLFTYNPTAFLIIQLAFFIAAFFIAKWQGHKGLSAWGLNTTRGWLKQLFIGMCLGILLYGVTFIISLLLRSERITSISSMLAPLGLFLFGNLFSSFSEDVLTRGYIYKHLHGKIATPVLIVTSALIYWLNHIYRITAGWETFGYLFCLGVLFVIPLIITKRLWLTGGMHWMGNVTFYFTHNIINTQTAKGPVSPNTILLMCILIFIPVVLFVTRRFKLNAT